MNTEYRYKVGGSLGFQDPSYVTRMADKALFHALKAGEFCYVLNSRQMGKSSLRVRSMQLLKAENIACAAIDMTRIGSKDVTADQWYKGLAAELERGFRLIGKIDKDWWKQQEGLSSVQRLSRFIEDILLVKVNADRIIVFFDEIDSILSLNFEIDDFFALIRSCYNHRGENPEYNRISFALFGVATPTDLIRDKSRTPFNIGRAIELKGFTASEAQPLIVGLEGKVANPEVVLQEILYWTGGQPFLTQKLCHLVVNSAMRIGADSEKEAVAKLVRSQFIDNWESQDEPVHLRTIRDRVSTTVGNCMVEKDQKAAGLLLLYQQILQEGEIPTDDTVTQRELCLSGLVVRHHSKLKVYNPIYESVFSLEWVDGRLAELRPYHFAIADWEASHCLDTSRLLRGQTLQEALAWAAGKNLSPLDYQFLNASQELAMAEAKIYWEAAQTREVEARLLEEKKNARQQKYLLMVVSLALIISTGLGLATFFQYRKAVKSELKAIMTSSEAFLTSYQRLDGLIEAIRAKRQLEKIGKVDKEIEIKIMRLLQEGVDGVQEYNRLSGHNDRVSAVAFSPNGEIIATGGRDNNIKIWRKDGSLVRTLRGHSGVVAGVVFSPDSQIIVSSSQDKTVKIWHINGTLLGTLTGYSRGVIGIDFSRDGNRIVSGSRDRTVKVWQRDSYCTSIAGNGNNSWSKCFTSINLKGHGGTVVGVAFSPDGKTIASASDDKTVKLWKVDGTLLATLKGHSDEVFGVAFSPDGKMIASASDDKTVKLWKIDGTLLTTIVGHTDEVYGVAFSRDGQTIATSSRDKTIKLWTLEGNLLATLSGHNGEIWQVAFSPDGKTIASASNDGTVKLWKPYSSWMKIIHGDTATVKDVTFNPNLETGINSPAIKVFSDSFPTGRELNGLEGKQKIPFFLASASGDNTIKLWRQDGTLMAKLSGHSGEVTKVAINPNGEEIGSGSFDQTIKLWNRDGKLLNTMKSHTGAVNGVSFSPDGKIIASASDDKTVKLWQSDGTLLTTLNGHSAEVRSVVFSPNSQSNLNSSSQRAGQEKIFILASVSEDKTVKFWNSQGKLLNTIAGHSGGVIGVAFSRDGKKIASASRDKTVKIWDIDGKLLANLTGHTSGVNSVAFSPDGKTIASASDDKTIRLWQTDGTLITILSGHSSGVNGVNFSPDGKILASASVDNTVILWNLDRVINSDALLREGCNWVKDYLKHNLDIDKRIRHVCDGVK